MTFREKMKHEFAKENDIEELYLFGETKKGMLQESYDRLVERNRELRQELAELKHTMEKGLFIEHEQLERMRDKDEDYIWMQEVEGQRFKITVEHEGESFSFVDIEGGSE